MEPVRPPIEPMLAKLASDLPPEGDVLYEPNRLFFRAELRRHTRSIALAKKEERSAKRGS